MADNPFAETSSPELDYAFELLRRPDAGPIEIDSATLVLQRCVDQAPGNERCLAGLVEARERAVASSALPPLLTPAQRRLAGQKPGLLRPENELPRPQRRGEGR